ncbi:unnamed protein product [Arctogadus glacialis]
MRRSPPEKALYDSCAPRNSPTPHTRFGDNLQAHPSLAIPNELTFVADRHEDLDVNAHTSPDVGPVQPARQTGPKAPVCRLTSVLRCPVTLQAQLMEKLAELHNISATPTIPTCSLWTVWIHVLRGCPHGGPPGAVGVIAGRDAGRV